MNEMMNGTGMACAPGFRLTGALVNVFLFDLMLRCLSGSRSRCIPVSSGGPQPTCPHVALFWFKLIVLTCLRNAC